MRIWVPIAVLLMLLGAYVVFYMIDSSESQGPTTFSLVNTIGLGTVILGVIAAGFILRRSAPREQSRISKCLRTERGSLFEELGY